MLIKKLIVMKRLFVAFAAFCLAAGAAFAQDLKAAVEIFNAGVESAQADNKAEALAKFQEALPLLEACSEEEAVEMVSKCKEYIPTTMLSIAKEQINAASYDEAIACLGKTVETAKLYEISSVAEEASSLIPNAWLRKGTSLLKEKNFADAAVALGEVVALTPEDGQSWLILGQARLQSGAVDEGVAALEKAAEFGKAEQANKMLSNTFLKKGQAALKAGKNADAIVAFEKANSYLENANAYKLIASANIKSGKSAKAIEAYKKYLEISPNAKDASDIIFTIAATAQKAGDKATAIEYYNKLSGDAKYSAQAAQQLSVLKK